MHGRVAVEVVPAAPDLPLPADRLARGRVDVVGLAPGLLPARQALSVGAVVALQPVGPPGEEARVHGRVAVEVVRLSIYYATPTTAPPSCRVEVVALPPEVLPSDNRCSVRSEIALGTVGPPCDPALLHHAFAVEVVPAIFDFLAPPHSIALGIKVIAPPFDSPPIRFHKSAIVAHKLNSVSYDFQAGLNGIVRPNRLRRLVGLIPIGTSRKTGIPSVFS